MKNYLNSLCNIIFLSKNYFSVFFIKFFSAGRICFVFSFILFFVYFQFFSSAFARSGSNGNCRIEGCFLDESAEPLNEVIINIGKYQANSNEKGRFFIDNLSPGKYEMILKKAGYKTDRSDIYIHEGLNKIELMVFNDHSIQDPLSRNNTDSAGDPDDKFLLSENSREKQIRKNSHYSDAVASLTGLSGLIDLPDASSLKKGQNIFGVHYVSMDGISDNADLFAYKWLYGATDNFELSITLIDTKTGKHETEQSSEDFAAALKYRISEDFDKFDIALGGQFSENRDHFFGVVDCFIDHGKMSFILKNNNGGRNLSLNIGMEFNLTDLEKYTRGKSSIIFEAEQYEDRFELFNLGLRHRTGRKTNFDLIYMQDRRYDDVNGSKTGRLNSFVIGTSIAF
jgi:hypothetical protein